jgi:hypothetical protein
MNPATYYQLAQARIADQHHDAKRERVAKLSRDRGVLRHTVPVLARLALTRPGARSPSPTR